MLKPNKYEIYQTKTSLSFTFQELIDSKNELDQTQSNKDIVDKKIDETTVRKKLIFQFY
jgi:hypothetical protein